MQEQQLRYLLLTRPWLVREPLPLMRSHDLASRRALREAARPELIPAANKLAKANLAGRQGHTPVHDIRKNMNPRTN